MTKFEYFKSIGVCVRCNENRAKKWSNQCQACLDYAEELLRKNHIRDVEFMHKRYEQAKIRKQRL